MCAMAPNLEELTLTNWRVRDAQGAIKSLELSTFASLRTATLENMDMMFPKLPFSLDDLTISNCLITSGLPDPLPAEFPSLKALKVTNNHGLRHLWIEALLVASKGTMEFIDLTGFGHIAGVHLVMNSNRGWCQSLRELYFAYVDINDVFLGDLVKETKNLEVIDLSHTGVTSLGIKEVVLSQQKLRQIKLLNCHYVSLDVVEFARKRGITVNYFFPDNKKRKYAKRVRE